MWFYTKIVSFVLFISWFAQKSESTPNEACREFLLTLNRSQDSDLKEAQFPESDVIQNIDKKPTSVMEHYHSKGNLTEDQKIISDSGSLFNDAATLCLQKEGGFPSANGTKLQATCPFLAPISCNRSAVYRTFDGSCNNLQHPYWGRANTPFTRLQPAEYSDGIKHPRCESVAGGPLPGTRNISVQFHRMSNINDANKELSHLTMSFGQFITHDFTSLVTHNDFDCCGVDEVMTCPNIKCQNCPHKVFYEMCLPIPVPQNDPYFSQFNKTCIEFARAVSTPNLQCELGPKEHLNSQSSYIDCSQVYGISLEEANSLRQMVGGLLKITQSDDLDLLPHKNNSFCLKPDNYCFITGDFRANQNPMIITMHTLFVREHNRIAGLLAHADPSLDDETLFQKARQILIAQTQHIIYNEYLPKIMGKTRMQSFGLRSLIEGYTSYSPMIQASIFNAHAGAAFRFGHSMIRRSFSNGTGDQILLSPAFDKTDPFYQLGDAPTGFTKGLVNDFAQQTDRLLTDQVVDKLFERKPGNGKDLAATNIQRGRDIGLRSYTKWRSWCGLDVPVDFDGLTDHTREDRNRLRKIYKNVNDIDLWTGGVSEIHLNEANIGPTFTCIAIEQFKVLKYGDRFWYEHNGPTRLSPSQLNVIRTARLSRLFCDNTLLNVIQNDPFLIIVDPEKDLVNCDALTPLDICPFIRRWSGWSNWSACDSNSRYRSRNCLGPASGPCACTPNQSEREQEFCK